MWLSAGTYTVYADTHTGADHGIPQVNLNGSSIGTIDLYSASTVHVTATIATGVVVTTAGVNTFRWIVKHNKNAASSGYYAPLGMLIAVRTA
jgi:hypothetical protein